MKDLRKEAANLGQQISRLHLQAEKTKDHLKKSEFEIEAENLILKRKELLRYLRTGYPSGYVYKPVLKAKVITTQPAELHPSEPAELHPAEPIIENAIPVTQNWIKRFWKRIKTLLKWNKIS
jgi:hypothetical protein